MNSLHRRHFLGLGLGLASAHSLLTAAATGQTTPPPAPGGGTPPPSGKEELLKFKKLEITQQQAPDFSLKGATKEKRFKAKDWLELDFEWDVKPSKLSKDREQKFFDDVNIKYYVYLAPADEKKKKVLVADVAYINVPVDETIHSVVYLSPATMYNLTGDKLANKALITFYGAEATIGGTLVGRVASQMMNNAPWWQAPSLPPAEDGRLLPKHRTPFGPLWYDYFMEEKGEK